MKLNYKKMYAQAEVFLEIYRYDISPENRESLGSFVNMQVMNRLQKIYTIYRYKFFKSNILMNLGLLFNI